MGSHSKIHTHILVCGFPVFVTYSWMVQCVLSVVARHIVFATQSPKWPTQCHYWEIDESLSLFYSGISGMLCLVWVPEHIQTSARLPTPVITSSKTSVPSRSFNAGRETNYADKKKAFRYEATQVTWDSILSVSWLNASSASHIAYFDIPFCL